jgi:membrane-anchored protein YejM (alkaline phosphatase superfamily)
MEKTVLFISITGLPGKRSSNVTEHLDVISAKKPQVIHAVALQGR